MLHVNAMECGPNRTGGLGLRGSNALGHVRHLIRLSIGHKDQKFVATDPSYCIDFPGRRPQPLRTCTQDLVAGRMAEGVVDRLELIDVDEQRRQPFGSGGLQPLDFGNLDVARRLQSRVSTSTFAFTPPAGSLSRRCGGARFRSGVRATNRRGD